MDTDVVAYYCLTDEMLQTSGHQEPPQRSMTDAEVITTALLAARLFGGNFATARAFLESHGHVPNMLSKSQYNRRLHRAAPLLRRLFRWLALIHKRSTEEDIYLVDSFPAEAATTFESLKPGSTGLRAVLTRFSGIHRQQEAVFLRSQDSPVGDRRGESG